jgi:hypothetical protein
MNGRTKDVILILRALRVTCYHPARHLDTLLSSDIIRMKNPVNKKGRDGDPSTRNTKQIKAQEHKSQKNITIRTPQIH